MVRVKGPADPGGRVGGLKEAVARFGYPLAASSIGLEIDPWSWTVKLYVTELPEGMVWVVAPVDVMAKSEVVAGPIVMS